MLLSQIAGRISTDHGQFLVESVERAVDWDFDEIYKRLEENRLALTPHGFVVATARAWGTTTIEVEIHDKEPELDRAGWDGLATCQISVPNGRISIYAPEMTGVPDGTISIVVEPGIYLGVVLFGGLDSVTDHVGGVGNDHYRIVLWLLLEHLEPT